MKKILICLIALTVLTPLAAQDIKLTEPTKTGGKPLMEVLNSRKSDRTFIKKDLPIYMLSDLLWAAYGFNREDKRTVPSSQNRQEINVYVMFKDGIYLYDAENNLLIKKFKGDFRKALGNQEYVMDAALNLIYVANMDKASNREAAYTDTGFIAQNVYLYAASAGLGTVARGAFKRPDLHDALGLFDNEEITLTQSVGYVQ